MSTPSDRKSPFDARPIALLTISTLACVLMSIFKLIFCALAPEVLSGSAGLDVDTSILLAGFLFLIIGYVFVYSRINVRLALFFIAISSYFLFAVGSMRGQLIIFHLGREFDLVDAHAARWDAFLRFNWSSYFEWVASRPTINWILTQAYHSIWLQPFLLVALFVKNKNVREFAKLQIALPLSLIMVCFIATFFPALGAYQFHEMTPDRHPGMLLAFTDGMTAPISWLRQADLPSVMPSFPELRIVQFPSWHAAAAAIFILSAWGQPIVRWIGLALNLLMLAATPVQGSHYLSDMMIGCAAGSVAFAFASWTLSDQPLAGLTAFAKRCTAGTASASYLRPR